MLRGGEVYNISRARLLEILTRRARDLGVHIEHCKEVGVPADLADADLIVAADGINSRMRRAGSFTTTKTAERNKHIWLSSDRLFTKYRFWSAFSRTTSTATGSSGSRRQRESAVCQLQDH